MRVEDLAIDPRPRDGWEAVDLGLRMTRHWLAAIYLPWLIVYLGLAGVLILIMPDELGWVTFILWWLKPLYDRLMLFVLSRAVFGQTPSAWQTLTSAGAWLRSGLLMSLTLARLNPARSFHLPVRQLEGLKGGQASRRRGVLNRGTHGHAAGFTLVWVHLEVIIWASLLGLGFLLVPDELDFDWWGFWIEDNFGVVGILTLSAQILATGLLEPFYVAGGFSLYLNRRSELEGWDLELAFKRLSNRFGNHISAAGRSDNGAKGMGGGLAASLLLVTLGLGALPESPAHAEVSPRKEAIQRILASDEFEDHETITTWVRINPDEPSDGLDLDWMEGLEGLADVIALLARSGEILLWVGLAVLLLILLAKRHDIARLLGRIEPVGRAKPTPPPTVAGLDIRPESLPDDVAAAAREAWARGDRRGALSLLYRGSVSSLVHRFQLRLKASHTEGDILARSQGQTPEALHAYLSTLTEAWRSTAYAHREPEESTLARLCDEWSYFFAPERSVESKEGAA